MLLFTYFNNLLLNFNFNSQWLDEATLEQCIQQAKGTPIEQEIELQADQSVENVEIPAEVHDIPAGSLSKKKKAKE